MTYWGITTPEKNSKRSGLPPPSPRRGGDLPIAYSATQGQPSTHDNLIRGGRTSTKRLHNYFRGQTRVPLRPLTCQLCAEKKRGFK
jgi:hypothetical protein